MTRQLVQTVLSDAGTARPNGAPGTIRVGYRPWAEPSLTASDTLVAWLLSAKVSTEARIRGPSSRTAPTAPMDMQDIYPLGLVDPALLRARHLLQEGLQRLSEAIDHHQMEEPLNADDCVLRLRALL